MKKIFAVALSMAAVLSAGAQKEALKQAKKLSGKLDKIEEARSTVQGALSNPETSGSAETYFIAGNIEFDAYDKGAGLLMLNAEDPAVNQADMPNQLLNGYNYYLKAMELDAQPNDKGQVKPKYTKDIKNKIVGHANDYYKAGADFFNTQKFYPEAYTCFEIFGHMDELGAAIPDSVRGEGMYYAALAALNAKKLKESADAFKTARDFHFLKPEAFSGEIAACQQVAEDDPFYPEAQQRIVAVAEEGNAKFGMSQPVFLSNIINDLVMKEQYDQAAARVQDAIATTPDNAQLYNLLAFTYGRSEKWDDMESAYRKMAECPDVTVDLLENAADLIYKLGVQKNNSLQGNSEEDRAAKKDIYDNYVVYGLSLVDKMNALEPGTTKGDYVKENLEYLGTLLGGN